MQWLNEYSRSFLAKGYLTDGVNPEQRLRFIAEKAEEILRKPGFGQKFFSYLDKGFYSLSSPIWANFGIPKGLPISCFGGHISDSMSSILFAQAEAGMMSKYGGGTSGYFGDLRPRGAPIRFNGSSSGSVHFMQLFEALINVVSQGSTRRGHYSPYLPVDHPDIIEFLDIGTEGNPIQDLTHGVTVTDSWMQQMIDGDLSKREIWAKIIQRRAEIGYPYIIFIDTVNKNTVDVYEDKELKIPHSNLCSELALPDSDDWSYVCDLGSMNIANYDTWKSTDAVETLVYFLDAVMTDFIEKLAKLRDSDDRSDRESFHYMERAYNFAVENRALGLGVLGWHSYLQSRMIPFESMAAKRLNLEIFRFIKERSYAASVQLSQEYGEPTILESYGRRNTTLNAVAPTTSSAFILGQVSQSIEPIWSNCYVKDIDKMKVTIYNPALKKLLSEKGRDTREVWNDIRDHDGSIQHCKFLSDEEKEVFKTFSEIDPVEILDQASTRQLFIDQSQSLNLMINPTMPVKDINNLYITAWKIGIKSLYYQHSTNAAQKFSQSKLCGTACEA